MLDAFRLFSHAGFYCVELRGNFFDEKDRLVTLDTTCRQGKCSDCDKSAATML